MTIRVTLALQGGGAHGAFTWGVLDRLLQEDGIEIAGISGTSAGALNGAALKAGLVAGGRPGARQALDRFWRQVARVGDLRLSSWLTAPAIPYAAAVTEFWETVLRLSPQGLAAQVVSPYTLGGAWHNPLEQIVRRLDFAGVCARADPAFFVSATNVRNGKVRVFSGDEITPAALMASACLPTVFQAVEIDGEAYWDGGYSGNPALFPLYGASLPDDMIIVQVNPLRREEVPTTAPEIQNRINEISFNAPLMRDLRSIAFVKRLVREGRIPPGVMKDMRVHMIADDGLMQSLTAATKMLPSPWLLFRLKRAGRRAATAFLRDHGAKLGHEGSVDLAGLYG